MWNVVTGSAAEVAPVIKSLLKAAQILDAFTDEAPERSLGELAVHCGMPAATVRRILVTLEQVGFVRQDPVTRCYRLGIKLFELGYRAAQQIDLRRVARPHLEALVKATGESAYLSIYDRGEVLYIDRAEAPQPIQLTSRVGQRLPAHSTGTGKVFLAHLPPEELDRFLAQPLERFTPYTVTDPARLREELKEVRERGYATTLEEHLLDTFAVAAPVFGPEGRVVAAVGISGPRYRVDAERLELLAREVVEAARAVSEELGVSTGG